MASRRLVPLYTLQLGPSDTGNNGKKLLGTLLRKYCEAVRKRQALAREYTHRAAVDSILNELDKAGLIDDGDASSEFKGTTMDRANARFIINNALRPI
jgi:hypothetical protein